MTTLYLVRLAVIPPMLAALFYLLKLAVTLFRLALVAGTGEALLVAWVLAFVVGLPAVLVLLSLARMWGPSVKRFVTIPFMGVQIPELGQ